MACRIFSGQWTVAASQYYIRVFFLLFMKTFQRSKVAENAAEMPPRRRRPRVVVR